METYDLGLLEKSRASWEESAGLRAVYRDVYRHMCELAAPGSALEIGSGCGTMKEFLPDVTTSDVRQTPFVDCAASAYALEDAPGGPWSTMYLLDVLHHLREPIRFFASAAKALRRGGRIVMCEPAATPLARVFYGLFHIEPIQPRRVVAPYSFPADDASGGFANMGMAWALFERDREPMKTQLATLGLSVRTVVYRDFLAYPASGGFSGPRLIPGALVPSLLAIERRLPGWARRFAALRMLVVLEK